MDSDRPIEGGVNKEGIGTKSSRAPNSRRPLTDLEKKACEMANFPETCAHKALGAFWRRVRLSGPEQEVFLEGEGVKVLKLKEVEVLMEDGYWSDKAGTVHERMFVATWLWLHFRKQGDKEVIVSLCQLIQRLADKYMWLTYPVVKETRVDNN